jgi:peptide-methionine (R)-S-oxide reductase
MGELVREVTKLQRIRAANYCQRPSRRSFLAALAGAGGAVALWSLRPAGAAFAATTTQGMVTIVEFGTNGKTTGKVVVPKVVKSDAEWQKLLSPISYQVTRQAGTERPYTGDTLDVHDRGLFRCICCDAAVFSSETKFDSGTGWPSFWQPIARENVVEATDRSYGIERTAVSCRQCDAHLGHVFPDGPRPTGLRYCMNSAAMHFFKLA